MTRKLSIVLGKHGQVGDLRSGAVEVGGVNFDFVEMKRMPDAYREMVRHQPYEICELAPTAYLMALEAGAPITGLPIPMTRRFRHQGVLRHKNGVISVPGDLNGKRVGVRAYSVTAAIWTRGVLAEEYGVDMDSIIWAVQEEDNVTSFQPPKNVHMIAEGETIASLMQKGELDAAFAGMAGIGADHVLDLVDVVDDAATQEKDYFARTGIYPVHGVIAIRNDVIRDIPDIGMRLFEAFSMAKQNYWARVKSGEAAGKEDLRYLKLSEVVGEPLPYGLEENRRTFEALVRFATNQRMIKSAPTIESVFPDPRVQSSKLAMWN